MKTPKFLKAIRFGLGFRSPVVWKGRSLPQALGQYHQASAGGPRIELSGGLPLWDQVRVYGHEVLHAAIDFDLHCQRIAEQLQVEALDTERELKED